MNTNRWIFQTVFNCRWFPYYKEHVKLNQHVPGISGWITSNFPACLHERQYCFYCYVRLYEDKVMAWNVKNLTANLSAKWFAISNVTGQSFVSYKGKMSLALNRQHQIPPPHTHTHRNHAAKLGTVEPQFFLLCIMRYYMNCSETPIPTDCLFLQVVCNINWRTYILPKSFINNEDGTSVFSWNNSGTQEGLTLR